MGEYFFGITDKGKRRQNNEDTFIVSELHGKGLVVACVIDGVGGYNGGEVAAAIARNFILEKLQHITGDISKAITQAIDIANSKIREEKKKNSGNDQMACVLTCAVADINNNKLYYAHVGDTRLYLLRDQSLVKLSKDHSAVGFLEDSGRLTEEDAMRHPRRNEIHKALGFEENIGSIKDFIETGESPFLPQDVIFLCSDGLSDMISSVTISAILAKNVSIPERARQLIDAANDAGGEDNITVVLVENNKRPKPQAALKPVEKIKGKEGSRLYVSKPLPGKKNTTPGKKRQGLKVFLMLFFLGILTILLFQNNTGLNKNNVYLKTTVAPVRNEEMDQLKAAAADSTKIYSVSTEGSFIKLSAPVSINKDSFLLLGKGVTIACDPGYKGPAFIVTDSTKEFVLDGVLLKDFDMAFAVQKNNIVFRNVRFINCRVPVQYGLSFRDSVVNGRLSGPMFIPDTNNKKRQ